MRYEPRDRAGRVSVFWNQEELPAISALGCTGLI